MNRNEITLRVLAKWLKQDCPNLEEDESERIIHDAVQQTKWDIGDYIELLLSLSDVDLYKTLHYFDKLQNNER